MLISAAIERLDNWFSTASASFFRLTVIVLVLFTIANNGLGRAPYAEPYRQLALNPFIQVTGINYHQESSLLPLVAYYLGFNSELLYPALCLSIILFTIAVFASLSRRYFGAEISLLAVGLLLAHPVTNILFTWLGYPDPITFLVTILLLFANSSALVLGLCLVGAFNHPVMFFSAPVILSLRIASKDGGILYRHLLFGIAGLLLGYSLLYLFLASNNINISRSRFDLAMNQSLLAWININIRSFTLSLYSLQGIVWFAIVWCVLTSFQNNRSYFILFLAAQLLFYLITFFTLDATRIFSLLAIGPTLHLIIYSMRLVGVDDSSPLSQQFRRTLLLVTIAGILIPKFFMWEGKIHAPFFEDFFRIVKHSLNLNYDIIWK